MVTGVARGGEQAAGDQLGVVYRDNQTGKQLQQRPASDGCESGTRADASEQRARGSVTGEHDMRAGRPRISSSIS